MSNIGLMEGAYFVGRKEIMEWVNTTLNLSLSKVEETASGAVACQILDIMHPGQVPMHKVNWSAKQSFEFVANYKILQTCFTKLGIDRHVDVDRLITGKYMDNLEFMQWYKAFFERQVTDISDYDAYTQRCKGKGGATYGGGNVKGGRSLTSSKSTKTVSTMATNRQASKRTVTAKAADETPKENAMPKPNRQQSQRNPPANKPSPMKVDVRKYWVEIEKLKATSQDQNVHVDELKGELEGLEKERDFYFEKLRDIEVFLQDIEDKGEGNDMTAAIFKILYATQEGFEAVGDDAEAEESEIVEPAAVSERVSLMEAETF